MKLFHHVNGECDTSSTSLTLGTTRTTTRNQTDQLIQPIRNTEYAQGQCKTDFGQSQLKEDKLGTGQKKLGTGQKKLGTGQKTLESRSCAAKKN